jgi:hypothetical protein
MTWFTTIARFLGLTSAVTIPGWATGKESEKEAKGTLDSVTIERELVVKWSMPELLLTALLQLDDWPLHLEGGGR